ncbi:MAG: hypothetical protein MJZ00_03925 [Paludibacteraceae bacterium]|nr:hypothetical protein [Paludibacteraceae bacterium]
MVDEEAKPFGYCGRHMKFDISKQKTAIYMKNQSLGKHHNMLCLENTLTVKTLTKKTVGISTADWFSRQLRITNYALRITH